MDGNTGSHCGSVFRHRFSAMTIPIVLLHHNEPHVLIRSVEAIVERTKHPFQLYVVDNASSLTDENAMALQMVSELHSVIVIRNPRNNWIYGFNLALKHPLWPDSELYVFSDADIIVPNCIRESKCWLGYMIDQMEQNQCIGKLGLSLDLANIERNQKLQATYAREQRYMRGKKIGPNIIAPVDTILAIYRRDLFITKFRFTIGHSSLVKPHYYICRTSPDWSALHVGWDYYPGAGQQQYSEKRMWKKSLAMSRVGAYTDPSIMARFPYWRRSLLLCIRSCVRAVFGLRLMVLMLVYILVHFPRRLNEIQAGCQ